MQALPLPPPSPQRKRKGEKNCRQTNYCNLIIIKKFSPPFYDIKWVGYQAQWRQLAVQVLSEDNGLVT